MRKLGNRIHPSYIYQVSVLKFSDGLGESKNKNKQILKCLGGKAYTRFIL